MKAIIFISLCLFAFGAFAQTCDSRQSCLSCAQTPGCGWCAPVQQCMNGTFNGPTTGTCLGDAWEYQACTQCSSYTDCKTCLLHDSDCFFCNSTQSCKPIGFTGCPHVKTCPCEQYDTCYDCTAQNGCGYCPTSQTCVSVQKGCPTQEKINIGSCDCPAFPDCRSCLDSDCSWCDDTSTCVAKNSTVGCLAAHSCSAYCASLVGCDACTNAVGCGYCATTQTCMSIEGTIPNCAKLLRTCPQCAKRNYCDTCLDEPGCTWCENSASCEPQWTGPQCLQTHSCVSYCEAIPDCETCNAVKGCGFCENTQSCTSVEDASCAFVHSCVNPTPVNPPKPGFDGGAFVGGMFLVIGIVALAGGAYMFYRWRTGQRLLYTELK